MSLPSTSTCSDCSRPLAAGAVEGLCSRCLLMRALDPLAEEISESTPPSPVMRYFGDYEILSEIARGGMGIVYRARQVKLERIVALKLLAAGEFASPQFVERFQTEAKAAAGLDHPNIVPIYEVGETGGQSFFTMRLIDGGTLAEHIRNKDGPLSNHEAATILVKLTRAVHFAHQRGVLHRDLKPGNVLLDSQCEPLLTDFGLAKLVEHDSTLTHTQSMLGTPAYMSPEQAARQGRNLTTATDVYGLGAILYELLTGKPPFRGASAIETARLVVEQEPRRPSALNPAVDRDLEVICLKCLEKEPARRYRSAEAVGEDLERFLRHEPIEARPVGSWERAGKWVRRKPRQAAILGVLAITLLALVIVPTALNFRLSDANRRAAVRAEENREQLVRFNITRGIELMNKGDLAGSLPWFVKALQLDEGHPEREEVHRVRIRSVLNQIPRLVRILQVGTNLTSGQFSPDGTRVLVHSETEAFAQVLDIASGQPTTPPMQHPALVRSAAFDATAERVLTVCYDGTVRIWDAHSGQPLLPPLRKDSPLLSAMFTPDGKQIITGSKKHGLWFWNATTGASIRGLFEGETVHSVACTPDGNWIAAGLDRGVQLFNPRTGTLPPLLESGMRFPMEHTQFSDDSSRVLGSGGDGTLVWDLASHHALTPPLTHPNFWVYGASFSPQGKWILSFGRDGLARVWGSSGQPSTTPALRHGNGVRCAEFSPDGLRIVTASDDHTACIWDAASGEPLCVLQHGSRVLRAGFSRDGRLVLTVDAKSVRVWDLAATARERHLIRVGRPHGFVFSSDGSQIFVADGERQVRLWDIATGRELPISAASSNTPLPTLVYTMLPTRIAHPDGLREIRREDAASIRRTSDQQKLTPPLTHREALLSASFSPGGRYILTAGFDRTARVWEVESGDAVTPPLRASTTVYHAIFDSNERQFAFLNQTDFIEVLDLSPDPRPVSDLEALAKLLSSRSITPLRSTEEIDDEELYRLYRELSRRHPSEFTTTEEERRRWQWREAALAFSAQTDAAGPISQWLNAEADPGLWIWRARLEVHRKDFTNALFSYDQALAREKQDATLWREQGGVLQKLGSHEDAIASFNRAVELAPTDALVFRDRARYRLERAEPKEALEDVSRAIALAPNSAELFELRGAASTAASQWKQAVSNFAQARELKRRLTEGIHGTPVHSFSPRDPSVPANCLDLESYFTNPVTPGWLVPIQPGAEIGLQKLPSGLAEFHGTVFDIRGVAQLAGAESRQRRGTYPTALRGIQLPSSCHRIHFLHGTEGDLPSGTVVGKITIYFEDAPAVNVPLRQDEQIAALFSSSKQSLRDPGASVVWATETPTRLPYQALTRLTWENPNPNARPVMLDYESTVARYGPALLAVTVETTGRDEDVSRAKTKTRVNVSSE